MIIVAIVASLMVKLPAELAVSHKELVRTNKIRTEEEAASAAAAAWKIASNAFEAPSCPVTLGKGKSSNPADAKEDNKTAATPVKTPADSTAAQDTKAVSSESKSDDLTVESLNHSNTQAAEDTTSSKPASKI